MCSQVDYSILRQMAHDKEVLAEMRNQCKYKPLISYAEYLIEKKKVRTNEKSFTAVLQMSPGAIHELALAVHAIFISRHLSAHSLQRPE
jgi:hypothetical protein